MFVYYVDHIVEDVVMINDSVNCLFAVCKLFVWISASLIDVVCKDIILLMLFARWLMLLIGWLHVVNKLLRLFAMWIDVVDRLLRLFAMWFIICKRVVDMFVNSYHIETIVLLSLKDSKR